jgi:CubicO group peptidase (beta-lactamase class C family)
MLPAACLRRATLVLGVLGPVALGAQPRAAGSAGDATSLGALADRALARAVAAGGAGCTIGVQSGDLVVTRGAGLADLERGVPLTPASIIEAGSVSKQFTAAAVLLLALDGRLDLDADVRRWFPEMPAYDRPVTVRHLLTHTSGLRDWGSLVQLEGWPRGARAHTNAHVVQVAARQRALNYAPGDAYSYTNTGYNLLAELVTRVSGRSLADFTRDRLFRPLGMASTSWRDDHRRVVPGRALAYTAGAAPRLSMPDESAHGNGGLLTTVADLLRWTDAMNTRALGPAFADSLVRRMVLTGGDTIDYALGVNVLGHRGTRELSHSGSTGGYRAHLLHFPERRAGVAVLCNGAGLNATQLAEQLADSVVGPRARRPRAAEPVARPAAAAATRPAIAPAAYAPLAGTYATDEIGGEPMVIAVEAGELVLRQAPDTRIALRPAAGATFQAAGQLLWFDVDAAGRGTALHIASDRAWDVAFPRVAPSR